MQTYSHYIQILFSVFAFSRIVCTSHHTDLFVEVSNITKGNSMWAHFMATGCFPSQIWMSRPIQKEDVQIETWCCIFKCMRDNWSNITVTGISGITINMPKIAKVSTFMDNDLTHITNDTLRSNWLLDYWIKYMLYNHLCYHWGRMMHHQVNMNIYNHLLVQVVQDHQHHGSQNSYICFLLIHRYKVWLHGRNIVLRCFMMIFGKAVNQVKLVISSHSEPKCHLDWDPTFSILGGYIA